MKIKKLNYSLNPWRIVNAQGREVWVPEILVHPDFGDTFVEGPLCASTKGALVQMLLDMVERELLTEEN
ncbi:MAG: hypothetical protein GY757_18970 [bacterium]|nr:hypothetical protein [bacterium]